MAETFKQELSRLSSYYKDQEAELKIVKHELKEAARKGEYSGKVKSELVTDAVLAELTQKEGLEMDYNEESDSYVFSWKF